MERTCPRSFQAQDISLIPSPHQNDVCAQGPSWRAMACCPVHLVSHITWEWRPALRGINSLLPYLEIRFVPVLFVAIIVVLVVV